MKNRDNLPGIGRPWSKPGLLGCHRSQFKPNDGHHGTHDGGRHDYFNPFDTPLFDHKRNGNKKQSKKDKAGLCMAEIPVGTQNEQSRGNKGETRAQVGGNASPGDPGVNQSADAIHQQGNGRIYPKQNGYEDGRSKHGRQVLKTERQTLEKGKFLPNTNNSSGHDPECVLVLLFMQLISSYFSFFFIHIRLLLHRA